MKRVRIVFISILGLCMLLSFDNETSRSSEVFLSLEYKSKVSLYNTATKKKLVKQLGHNFKDEDYLLFTIIKSNDSMYLVKAYYAIAGKEIKGWINKNTKLAVFSNEYNKKLNIYESFNKKKVKVSLNYIKKELEVLDCHSGWLKVRIANSNKTIVGWIPPESQCSNPYTTCN